MHRKIRWAPSRVHTKHISFSVPDLHSSSLAILQWRFCEGNLAPQWKPHQEHGWLLFLKGKKEDNQVWSHFYGVDLQVEEKVQWYSKYLNASNGWLVRTVCWTITREWWVPCALVSSAGVEKKNLRLHLHTFICRTFINYFILWCLSIFKYTHWYLML